MLDQAILQIQDSTIMLGMAVIIAVIISAGIAAAQIRSLKKKADPKIKFQVERLQKDFHDVSEDLEKFRDAIPRTTEVGIVRDDVSKLCGDFDALKDGMEERMSRLSRDTAEDLNLARDEMINMASEKFADSHIRDTRDEFDSLKGRLEKYQMNQLRE